MAPVQPNAEERPAVMGAKMVDANPATSVRTVRARIRAGPYQRLTSRPAEKAPVTRAGSQPVSWLTGRTAAINA